MKPPKGFGPAADPSLGGQSPLDFDMLRGRTTRVGGQSEGALSVRLQQRIGSSRSFARSKQKPPTSAAAFQKAVVKARQVSHASPTAREALRRHVRYISRDGAERAGVELLLEDKQDSPSLEPKPLRARASAHRSLAYNDKSDGLDPLIHSRAWTQEDKKHYRLIVSIERGGALGSLRPLTRAMISEASDRLGKSLDWLAIDHWDTSNPHTHILLRGRSLDGGELFLPDRFLKHDLRAMASRIAAQELNGARHGAWRAELFREARRHGPTRLDALLSAQTDAKGRVELNKLWGFNADPDVSDALKARARELQRLGLAQRTKGALELTPAWRDRLALLARDLSHSRALQQGLSRSKGLTKSAHAWPAMGGRLD